LVFRTTFWRVFSQLWEIFMKVLRTRGFSTVSLGFIVVLSISGTEQSSVRRESTNGAKITG
jgi:hypothetical protein